MSEDSSKSARSIKPKLAWSPLAAILLIIALYFLTPIVSNNIVSVPMYFGWLDGNGVVVQFLYIALIEAMTVAAVVWFLRLSNSSVATLGLGRFKPKHVVIGLLVYPIYFILFAIIAVLATQLIPSLNVNQEQQLGFNNVTGAWPLILTFISLVVLPPIVEELTVRGLVFTSLRSRLNMFWATIMTSLIFAAAHLPEGGDAGPLYIAALDTFALSVVLCIVRERTNSLWPCIVLHALKNGIAYVSLYIFAVG